MLGDIDPRKRLQEWIQLDENAKNEKTRYGSPPRIMPIENMTLPPSTRTTKYITAGDTKIEVENWKIFVKDKQYRLVMVRIQKEQRLPLWDP